MNGTSSSPRASSRSNYSSCSSAAAAAVAAAVAASAYPFQMSLGSSLTRPTGPTEPLLAACSVTASPMTCFSDEPSTVRPDDLCASVFDVVSTTQSQSPQMVVGAKAVEQSKHADHERPHSSTASDGINSLGKESLENDKPASASGKTVIISSKPLQASCVLTNASTVHTPKDFSPISPGAAGDAEVTDSGEVTEGATRWSGNGSWTRSRQPRRKVAKPASQYTPDATAEISDQRGQAWQQPQLAEEQPHTTEISDAAYTIESKYKLVTYNDRKRADVDQVIEGRGDDSSSVMLRPNKDPTWKYLALVPPHNQRAQPNKEELWLAVLPANLPSYELTPALLAAPPSNFVMARGRWETTFSGSQVWTFDLHGAYGRKARGIQSFCEPKRFGVYCQPKDSPDVLPELVWVSQTITTLWKYDPHKKKKNKQNYKQKLIDQGAVMSPGKSKSDLVNSPEQRCEQLQSRAQEAEAPKAREEAELKEDKTSSGADAQLARDHWRKSAATSISVLPQALASTNNSSDFHNDFHNKAVLDIPSLPTFHNRDKPAVRKGCVPGESCADGTVCCVYPKPPASILSLGLEAEIRSGGDLISDHPASAPSSCCCEPSSLGSACESIDVLQKKSSKNDAAQSNSSVITGERRKRRRSVESTQGSQGNKQTNSDFLKEKRQAATKAKNTD